MRFVTSTLRDAAAAAAATLIAFFPAAASAQNGMPQPWQMNLQPAATEVATFIHWFHDWINILIVAISVFVLALIIDMLILLGGRLITPWSRAGAAG